MMRLIVRVIRFAFLVYGVWSAWRKNRWLAAALAVWSMVRRRPRQNTDRKAEMMFVSALEPAIYQRKGWRKLSAKRTPI